MTVTDPGIPPPCDEAATEALHGSRRIFVLITLLLGAAFLFCHGCHAGDHDDELAVHLLDRER